MIGTRPPTRKIEHDRSVNAGAWVGIREVLAAVRARGGLISQPVLEVLFHWRLRDPIVIWRDPVTKRFAKPPSYARRWKK